jgi:hypothetical protein
MLILPEARAAILRASVFATVALLCIVGAIRAHRRWVRIILAVVAAPFTMATLYGIFVVYLVLHYGSR